MISSKAWLTVDQAAERLGVEPDLIRAAARRGVVKLKRINGRLWGLNGGRVSCIRERDVELLVGWQLPAHKGETREDILFLFDNGYPKDVIARRVGVSVRTVERAIRTDRQKIVDNG